MVLRLRGDPGKKTESEEVENEKDQFEIIFEN